MKDDLVKKGIDILFDFAATMGKSAVRRIFDPNAKDDKIETARMDIKRDFKNGLKEVVCQLLDDEEEKPQPGVGVAGAGASIPDPTAAKGGSPCGAP